MRKALARAIARALVAQSLLGLGLVLVAYDHPERTVFHGPSIPERMAAEHDCWTEGEHGLPGHVILTRDAHTGPEYLGGRIVGQALDQVFAGRDKGWRIYAFCP